LVVHGDEIVPMAPLAAIVGRGPLVNTLIEVLIEMLHV
jgi:hypothetical protein